MIQFNLLPDVKLEYLKTQKVKRSVVLGTISVTGLAVVIFVLMFLIVNVFQKQHIANLDTNIKQKTNELKKVQDIEKVLTVQNQLKNLPALHESKPAVSRLTDYLVQLTPSTIKVTDITLDFSENTMTINGMTDSLESINKLADTFKYTDFEENGNLSKAFSEVVLSNFGVKGKEGKTAYGLKLKFAKEIFDNTKQVKLVVPNIVTTQSVVEKPSDLFEQKPVTAPSAGGAQ